MTTTFDCDQYDGRRKSICEGREPDGSPLSMSERKRLAYLKRWETPWTGEDPFVEIDSPGLPVMQGQSSPRRGRPGDCLERRLKERGYTVKKECPCKDRIATMNRWGVEGCSERVDEIVGWLMESATSDGTVRAALIRVPGLSSIARHEIRKIVLLAIDDARQYELADKP